MRTARIDAASGLVVNVEETTAEWVEANADEPGVVFVPCGDDVAAGHTWEAGAGFATPEPVYSLTAETLSALALTAKQVAVLEDALTIKQDPTQ